MKTQIILASVACALAGAASASAQAVYSVNVVGYINLDMAPGLNLVANQLIPETATVGAILADAPDGSIVFKYTQDAGFSTNIKDFGEWGLPDQSLNPGEGFFLQNNGDAFTVTFVGEVPQGADSNLSLSTGLNLVGSAVPQAGGLETDLGYTPTEGDIVFEWNQANGTYEPANIYDFGEWSLGDPQIEVGQGFFVQAAADKAWDRNFVVPTE